MILLLNDFGAGFCTPFGADPTDSLFRQTAAIHNRCTILMHYIEKDIRGYRFVWARMTTSFCPRRLWGRTMTPIVSERFECRDEPDSPEFGHVKVFTVNCAFVGRMRWGFPAPATSDTQPHTPHRELLKTVLFALDHTTPTTTTYWIMEQLWS